MSDVLINKRIYTQIDFLTMVRQLGKMSPFVVVNILIRYHYSKNNQYVNEVGFYSGKER